METSQAALNKKPHVVVVDDDQEVQERVLAFFRPKGYQVECFADAEVALAASRETGSTWDVLLTDFHFPSMSGIEFTAQVNRILPKLPIIMITPPEVTETAEEAIRAGAYDFISKPIQFPQLRVAVERALHLNDLKDDISELRARVKSGPGSTSQIIGKSPSFLAALDIAKRVAPSSASVLITGESGTGKEVFAKFIHDESHRKAGPFVAINCTAIPETLLESELFGHVKGAFTGAHERRIGLFEEAQDGTLFLDEIGDLSLPLQAKLLRVVQERKIKRLGENQFRSVNCRIISATHKTLQQEVRAGRFREDLFFRLNVIPVALPPLRDRKEDVMPLAEFFLRKYAQENASPARSFSKSAVKFIVDNRWRGNVRELENTIERAVVLCGSSQVDLSDFLPTENLEGEQQEHAPAFAGTGAFVLRFGDHLPTLDEVIHKYVEFAVLQKGGARDRTAKELGIDRKTLYKRLRPDEFAGLQQSHGQI